MQLGVYENKKKYFCISVCLYLYAILLYAVQLNAAQGADGITCTISTLCGAEKIASLI